MNLPALSPQVGGLIAGLIAFAFGVADLWFFHSLDKQTDITFLTGGIAAIGGTGAFLAGLRIPTP